MPMGFAIMSNADKKNERCEEEVVEKKEKKR